MIWWKVVLIIYSIITFINVFITLTNLWRDKRYLCMSVGELYADKRLNIFGSILVWFLEFILNPVFWAGLLLYFIVQGIWFFLEFTFKVSKNSENKYNNNNIEEDDE